jgi:MOSC domain-containing protein YiiM
MKLISINSGKVAPLFTNQHPDHAVVMSGIKKSSVSNIDQANPVDINVLGLMGDEQADLSVHGGLEKAIYVYPYEHYSFWNALLSRELKTSIDLQPGAIGENFTISGLLEADVFVGDTLQIGDLEFIVTKLREPCFKFNAKMRYKGAAKAMLQSGHCGWYMRVITPGTLNAGSKISHLPGKQETAIADQVRAIMKRDMQGDLWDYRGS